jgi:SAM-dependent methyltransferase
VSQAEREKWNERYRSGYYEGREHPTALLADWAPRLPRGRALDVACGAGRNALFLAAAGFDVDAVDIAEAGLKRARETAAQRGLTLRFIAGDLAVDPEGVLPDSSYDLIVWVRYVDAGLMPHVTRRLAAGGHLLCEQHLATTADVVGPRSPEFRLQPNELLRAAAGLLVLFYCEGIVTDPDGRPAALAQMVARRAD